MCGNGARAVAALLKQEEHAQHTPLTLETREGKVIGMSADGHEYAVTLSSIELLPQKYYGETVISVSGEPHFTFEVPSLENTPSTQGVDRALPAANCTQFERISHKKIRARTFERGVNRVTESCGTGAVASAFAHRSFQPTDGDEVLVQMYSHTLRVQFHHNTTTLIGPARVWRVS